MLGRYRMGICCGSALSQLRTVEVQLLPARGDAAKLGCECIHKPEMWLQTTKDLIYFWTKVSLPLPMCFFFPPAAPQPSLLYFSLTPASPSSYFFTAFCSAACSIAVGDLKASMQSWTWSKSSFIFRLKGKTSLTMLSVCFMQTRLKGLWYKLKKYSF